MYRNNDSSKLRLLKRTAHYVQQRGNHYQALSLWRMLRIAKRKEYNLRLLIALSSVNTEDTLIWEDLKLPTILRNIGLIMPNIPQKLLLNRNNTSEVFEVLSKVYDVNSAYFQYDERLKVFHQHATIVTMMFGSYNGARSPKVEFRNTSIYHIPYVRNVVERLFYHKWNVAVLRSVGILTLAFAVEEYSTAKAGRALDARLKREEQVSKVQERPVEVLKHIEGLGWVKKDTREPVKGTQNRVPRIKKG